MQNKKRNLTRKFIPIGISIVLGLVVFFTLSQLIHNALAQSEGQSGQIEITTTRQPLSGIQAFQAILTSTQLNPTGRANIESKLKYAQREATRQAENSLREKDNLALKLTAIAQATAMANDPRFPTATPEERPVGLISDAGGISFTRSAFLTTFWIEKGQDGYFQVGTGCLAHDHSQGVVYLLIEKTRKVTQYPIPANTGALTITGMQDGLLTITSESGLYFYFDLNKKLLLDGEKREIIVATPTSLPAYP